MTKRKKLLISFLVILVIFVSIIITYFVTKKPKASEKPPVDNSVLVNVTKVYPGNYIPIINTLGKVEAAEQLVLMSEVSGKIIKVNKSFVPGGFIKKGDIILEIDPIDYKLALSEAKANLAKAESAYKQTLGRSVQAQQELKVYEKNTGKKIENSYLALRKPELEQAKSTLEQAKNALNKAQVNLDRTKVKAPFNIIVKERNVNYGSFVAAGSSLATLINTDYYWINTSIPLREMAFIDFANNPTAIIRPSYLEGEREASYFKLLNFLDDSARFMGLLLVIKDPLMLCGKKLNAPKIFLDDYVKVGIRGKELVDVFRIPLFTLKNNNIVWLIKENKLNLFKVDLVYQDDDYAYVKGLSEGDLIVQSDLSLVTHNMPVKIKNISNNNDRK